MILQRTTNHIHTESVSGHCELMCAVFAVNSTCCWRTRHLLHKESVVGCPYSYMGQHSHGDYAWPNQIEEVVSQ